MIVLGIDEAGYGPLLGPLVVSAVAFEVPPEEVQTDWWESLRGSVCRAPQRRDARLAVTDSKKLFSRQSGIAGLERAALVWLRVADRSPGCLRELVSLTTPDILAELDRYPWYSGFDRPLPVAIDAAAVNLQANALHRDLIERRFQFEGVRSAIVHAAQFNHRVGQTRNKASVLTYTALALVREALATHRGDAHVLIDRHGGRTHYREALMTYFEGVEAEVLEETDTRSAYRLTKRGRQVTLVFRTRGDAEHLPIALASIYSKYLRELLMMAVNAFFAERMDGLKPTAGYYTDAKRFLRDVDGVIRAEKLDRGQLIRCR